MCARVCLRVRVYWNLEMWKMEISPRAEISWKRVCTNSARVDGAYYTRRRLSARSHGRESRDACLHFLSFVERQTARLCIILESLIVTLRVVILYVVYVGDHSGVIA